MNEIERSPAFGSKLSKMKDKIDLLDRTRGGMKVSKEEKRRSWQMFDQISATYDFLNHVLSFGLDRLWRQRVIKYMPSKDKIKLIDIATGTGDLVIMLAKDNRVQEACGIDLSEKMLTRCEKKIRKKKLDKRIYLRRYDAQKTPFTKDQFDMASIAFGMRNIPDTLKALKETNRILKKNGVIIILELTIPENATIRSFYLLYFRFVLPVLGGLISGNISAYRYLNKTVEDFPQGNDFCKLLMEAGFGKSKYETYSMGIVTLYYAEKV